MCTGRMAISSRASRSERANPDAERVRPCGARDTGTRLYEFSNLPNGNLAVGWVYPASSGAPVRNQWLHGLPVEQAWCTPINRMCERHQELPQACVQLIT